MQTNLDENLYSRQLYVLGSDAMKSFQTSSVLVVGMSGLGQEIAKNIILAGISKVDIHDPTLVNIKDLSAGFYFTPTNIGQRRDSSVLSKLKELNPYVEVSVVDDINTHTYTTIVFTNKSYKELLDFESQSMIICCQVNGLFSQVFTDFKKFIIKDENGEPNLLGTINDVTDNVLTVIDDERHQMENNRIKIYKHNSDCVYECFVKAIDHKRVELIDYEGEDFFGGTYEEVKVPKQWEYSSLKDSIMKPKILNEDENAKIIHNCYFLYEEGKDLDVLYRKNMDSLPFKVYSEELVKVFEYMHDIEIMPMVSVIGGFVAQEVLKSCSGKFTPLNQYLYFESLESLNYDDNENGKEVRNDKDVTKEEDKTVGMSEASNSENLQKDGSQTNVGIVHDDVVKSNIAGAKEELIEEDGCKILQFDYLKKYLNNIPEVCISRYYSYQKLFKDKFDAIKKSSVFVVGAGAIGCEHLKNIVMNGIGVEGKIFLTDMDSIELSNLNRQFLFKQCDVTKMKSEIAAREARKLNDDYKTKKHKTNENIIECYNLKVGVSTEKIFSDTFFSGLTLVANALDNIEARQYVDQRCILNCVPLFESGTLGTQGNTQVILPHKTESYSSSSDPPEKSFPMCTLQNFPHLIEHTIEFALNEFERNFDKDIIDIKKVISKEERKKTKSIDENILDLLESIPDSEDKLLNNSFDIFYKLFFVNIEKMLQAFPIDSKTKEGIPFWSPPKRAPVSVTFSTENSKHILFVRSCCLLYANIYKIDIKIDDNKIIDFFNVQKDAITERARKKINKGGMKLDGSDEENTSTEEVERSPGFITSILEKYESYSYIEPIEFEKDDDTNHHIDFIYACANIRAQNYKIKEATKLQVKGIAGRIIPAIATTTAMVSGLSVLEMLKYVCSCKFESFRNTYLTLALPMITSSEPLEPMKYKVQKCNLGLDEYTLWDKIEFEDSTVRDFIRMFREKYDLIISMLTCNEVPVFCTFYQQSNYEKNMDKTFKELSKADEGTKYATLGCFFKDVEAEVPNIVVKFQ